MLHLLKDNPDLLLSLLYTHLHLVMDILQTLLFLTLGHSFSTLCEPDNLTSEGECYSPNNYDNSFRGPVTLRNALAQSLNIPAVKILYLTGLKSSLKLARDLGITTLTNPDQYGLTLVLGGGEVQLLEMVGVYGVFANEGIKNNLSSILRIEDSNGNIIEEFPTQTNSVLDSEVAYQISNILSDNVARTPLYGSNSLLHFPGRDVAAKTGTTNDYRDAWIVGYTPNIVVGAWAGNNDNSSMAKKISGLIITPLWRDFMDVAIPLREQETFTKPKKSSPDIKPVLRGVWFDPNVLITKGSSTPKLNIENTITTAHSILYYVDKNNPTGPTPTNPAKDSQFHLWEYGVSLWKSTLLGIGDEEKDEDENVDEE